MGNYFLAVDIGASSGRHILGSIQDGRIVIEEVYRFENGMAKKDGHLQWDVNHLAKEIVAGMCKCKEAGKIPVTMGIDTWGVDYVLLDGEGKIVGNTYGYRDGRTKGMDEEVYRHIPLERLYERNGIQKQIFNTVYQLMAAKAQEPEILAQAESLLMMPDYFNFVLTGVKKSEYTNATTGQLVHVKNNDWDWELMDPWASEKDFQPSFYAGNDCWGAERGDCRKSRVSVQGNADCIPRYGFCRAGCAFAGRRMPLYQFRYMVFAGNGNQGTDLHERKHGKELY